MVFFCGQNWYQIMSIFTYIYLFFRIKFTYSLLIIS